MIENAMPSWLKISFILLAIVVALLALDRLFLSMERRGWIYWRKIKPRGGGIAAGLWAFHELVEPQVRQIREEQAERRIDAEKPGVAAKDS